MPSVHRVAGVDRGAGPIPPFQAAGTIPRAHATRSVQPPPAPQVTELESQLETTRSEKTRIEMEQAEEKAHLQDQVPVHKPLSLPLQSCPLWFNLLWRRLHAPESPALSP